MREVVLRVVRVGVVAVLAIATYAALEPFGVGYLVLPLALAVTLGLALARRRRRRRVARHERWAEAVLDDARRPAAIAEVRAALAGGDAPGGAVRTAVLLAELLDAQGETGQAAEALARLDPATLDPVDAGVVRHARAVIRLRAGDPEGARAALGEPLTRTGAPDVDLRLELVAASADLELGEAESALSTATSVRRRAAADEALSVEARVVRAAALDALGSRQDAIGVVRALGPEMIEVLAKLGQPRVRALAEAARGK